MKSEKRVVRKMEEILYRKQDGLFYPNLVIGEDTQGEQNLMERKVMTRKMLKKNMAERSLAKENPGEKNLTEYGLLRLNYLKEQTGVMYEELLLRGELRGHLLEVQEQAEAMFQSLMERYLERMEMAEELKQTNPMEWVRQRNMAAMRARETVLSNLIYTNPEPEKLMDPFG
ncbi:MAG: TnpV protein [Lachnospiraceae bacterium]|nr:TnpV protein [Lachnospiraceae bacterium]